MEDWIESEEFDGICYSYRSWPLTDPAGVMVCFNALKAYIRAHSSGEAEGEAEHLRMQIGYIATELMVRGDPRSLPEIVKTAANATRPGRS